LAVFSVLSVSLWLFFFSLCVKNNPMSTVPTNPGNYSPWPHRCAWLLVCATFPLIWVGGLVTTTDAGMAFRDWITSDGYFMPFYPWLSSAGDKFVEHGHRLLGPELFRLCSSQ